MSDHFFHILLGALIFGGIVFGLIELLVYLTNVESRLVGLDPTNPRSSHEPAGRKRDANDELVNEGPDVKFGTTLRFRIYR